MNSITIVGNLTRDAETRPAGDTTVTSFSIAENKKVKGEKVTMYYDCSMWGDRGANVAAMLTMGGQITVVGELMPIREKAGKFYVDIRVQDLSLPKRQAAVEPNGAENW